MNSPFKAYRGEIIENRLCHSHLHPYPSESCQLTLRSHYRPALVTET